MTYIDTLKKLRRSAIRWAVIYAVVAVLLGVAALVFAPTGIWPTLAILAVVWAGFAVVWVRIAHKDKEKINEEQARIDRRATGGLIPGPVAGSYTGLTAAQIQQRVNAMLARYTAISGGYWGGTQAHRTGTPGSTGNSPGGSTGGGTSPRVTIVGDEQFNGAERNITPRPVEEVGFAPGVLRGTRSFKIDHTGTLRGVVYSAAWDPGENTARCLNVVGYAWMYYYSGGARRIGALPVTGDGIETEREPHPLTECHHGFYGYYDGSNDYFKAGMVSGVIEGYGECVVGTRGFRCMKARIIALHIPDEVPVELAALVRANYPDVPVCSSFESMVAEFPPDNPDD